MDNTSAAVLADRPDLANTLMFHIVGPGSCPVTVIDPDTGLPTTVQSTGTASDPALNALAWYDQPWVVVRGSENPDVPPESQFGSIAYLWTHEIMHALGLSHVYDGSAPLSNQSFDFCNDIFSCLQQADASNPYCASAATACPPPQPWSPITFCVQDDPGDCHVTTAASPFDKCTNNVMHRSVGRHSSNLQMGRMHRPLSATFLSTSATGYNPAILGLGDWAIQEIWDFPVKLYQDLHIRRDQTLVIPCRLELVEQAKIVVEPGGLLIVDGGVITNGRYYIEEGFYNKPWRGVEVWGNSAEDQVTPSDFNIWPIENLEHQGMVIIKNGGSIENAEIGVYLGKPGDPTKAGGVLRMESTSAGPFNTIRDCRRGVKYDPYIHHVPLTLGNYTGTMAVSNRSRFAHARFEFTDAFENIHGENNPVALIDTNGVRGLQFRACAIIK